MKILFYGDSITDVGRDRGNPASLGAGYPLLIGAQLGAERPGAYVFRNTGVGGDRSVDLYARVKKDCWNHRPDLVSILVGINDVWHGLGDDPEANGGDAERFCRVYRMLLEDTAAQLPGVRFLLMEPFVLSGTGTSGDWDAFSRELPLRAQAVRRLAGELHTLFLPLQEVFDRACTLCPSDYWLADGVHPTPAGHQLIADAWLDLFRREVIGK